MLIVGFLTWWYGPGWLRWPRVTRTRLVHLYQGFSVPILITTLFAPWRRIITIPGRSLSEKLRAIPDNAISRLVGFSVRVTVLLTACLLMIGWGIAGLIELIIWPLLPPLALVLLVWGVFR